MAVSVILQKFRSLPEKIGLKRLIGEDDFPSSKLFCERCSVLEGDLITGEVLGTERDGLTECRKPQGEALAGDAVDLAWFGGPRTGEAREKARSFRGRPFWQYPKKIFLSARRKFTKALAPGRQRCYHGTNVLSRQGAGPRTAGTKAGEKGLLFQQRQGFFAAAKYKERKTFHGRDQSCSVHSGRRL